MKGPTFAARPPCSIEILQLSEFADYMLLRVLLADGNVFDMIPAGIFNKGFESWYFLLSLKVLEFSLTLKIHSKANPITVP